MNLERCLSDFITLQTKKNMLKLFLNWPAGAIINAMPSFQPDKMMLWIERHHYDALLCPISRERDEMQLVLHETDPALASISLCSALLIHLLIINKSCSHQVCTSKDINFPLCTFTVC